MNELLSSSPTDLERIVANAEALCQTVASRDLGNTPLYIVPQSAIVPEFGNAEGCDGYTTPSLDL